MRKIGLVLAIAIVTGLSFTPGASAYHSPDCHPHEVGPVTTYWGCSDDGGGDDEFPGDGDTIDEDNCLYIEGVYCVW